VRQETQFPERDFTVLTIKAKQSVGFALKIRHPAWATSGLSVSVNGKKQPEDSTPGGCLTLRREWQDDDKIAIRFPMALHAEPLPGTTNTVAILYGPIVLAGEMGTNAMPSPIAAHQTEYSKLPAPDALVFVTDGGQWLQQVEPVAGQPRDVTLIPFYRMHRERYSVYWKLLSVTEWKGRARFFLPDRAH
jgi:DUF1680 family protein